MGAYTDAGGAGRSGDAGTGHAAAAVHSGDAAGDGVVAVLQAGEVELKVSE